MVQTRPLFVFGESGGGESRTHVQGLIRSQSTCLFGGLLADKEGPSGFPDIHQPDYGSGRRVGLDLYSASPFAVCRTSLASVPAAHQPLAYAAS